MSRAQSAVRSPRPLLLWARIRDSLWFIPAIGVLAAVALAALALTLRLPERYENSSLTPFLFSGEVGSARGVLSTIAGSLITVTGVVFSVTIVTLQLASTQFTPRVMRSFIADRTNQSVLGIFIGTFTYTLLVLGALGSPAYGDDGVPVVAVTLSLVLLLVSVGALILFINRSAHSAQVSTILRREAEHALSHGRELFPAGVGEGVSDDAVAIPDQQAAVVAASSSGYVQAVDGTGLLAIARSRALLLEMRVSVGEFVFPGKEMLRAWPNDGVSGETASRLCELFVIGPERTPEQDIEFNIGAVADIGVKALSPGINDPTTAMLAIDRLVEILRSIAGEVEPRVRAAGDGIPRLITRRTTFERAAGLAFDQMRVNGGHNPAIVKKILDSILDLAPLVGPAERSALRREAALLVQTARQRCPPHELPPVEELAAKALAE